MIETRTYSTKWKETTEEEAREYARYLIKDRLKNIDKDKKITYIEKTYIRGISVKKLLEEE